MDIETYLCEIAKKGLIWILKDMHDISNLELIAIEYYLSQYRTNQIYDNLETNFIIQTSKNPNIVTSLIFSM